MAHLTSTVQVFRCSPIRQFGVAQTRTAYPAFFVHTKQAVCGHIATVTARGSGPPGQYTGNASGPGPGPMALPGAQGKVRDLARVQ